MIQIFIFKLLIFSDMFLFNLPGIYAGGPERRSFTSTTFSAGV